MALIISKQEKKASFYLEETAFLGVRKIAKKVAQDCKLVTGKEYEVKTGLPLEIEEQDCIIAATIGKSAYLEELEAQGRIDLSKVRGKREVYSFTILKKQEQEAHNTLVIAGSDKRGTIYGLFHLSELLGVSPWVYFADVMPRKQETVVLTEEVNMVSKEPSVKYRGFFINDEWPSFGNWTFRHFGGFTAEMYDHVFELLLRLKGNYLWPAMWTSSFSLDGPGLANAELADEYGIVMSNSHHEPCLRHSEEWDLVKGEDSVYGDAWNFDRNKQGLTNYWRDGLKRNGGFENIITMGMRGERDSEILGHTATLKENIDYLKEVITTQNELIRETINEDLSKDPIMLALYKEVESYFYGDEKTPGLKDWDELDGVTFMLCEDNFGNMRTLPTKDIRERDGGWGMYYHFDYHGDPVSYEWVNSTYLAKVWEQMTQAYEFGIRDIWIVNVGDLKPQELPLSYFLDLAYDFEKWGTAAPNKTVEYTKQWIQTQFGAIFSSEEQERILEVLDGYTRLNSIRKPESLSALTYHPVHYGEADWVFFEAEKIVKSAEELKNLLEMRTQDKDAYASFYELVYYPAVASMNLLHMQLYAGKNALCVKQGRVEANIFADRIRECIEKDRELQQEYHSVADGKWDGIMLSEHVGFVHWNDEECRYPVRQYIEPANKPRMVVSLADSTEYTMGGDWTRKTLQLKNFMDPSCRMAVIDISNGSTGEFDYTASCDADWLKLSEEEGTVHLTESLVVMVDRECMGKIPEKELKATITIKTEFAKVMIEVYARNFTEEELSIRHYVPVSGNACTGLAIEAHDYDERKDSDKGSFSILKPYGKYVSGVKAFPVTQEFIPGEDAPALTYKFWLPKFGNYQITLLSAPSNPVDTRNLLRVGFQWNQEKIELLNSISREYRGGDRTSASWGQGVLDNIHSLTITKEGMQGDNTITIYGCDPGFVLERILIKEASEPWASGYLGIVPNIEV